MSEKLRSLHKQVCETLYHALETKKLVDSDEGSSPDEMDRNSNEAEMRVTKLKEIRATRRT